MYTRAEINLSALTHNLNTIKSLSPGKQIIAVVKANAYGHGIKIVSTHLHSLGVRSFAVSSTAEADEISSLVPDSDIIIFGLTPQACVKNNYIHTIASVEQARNICRPGDPVTVHIKLDTGMSRFGINTLDELHEIMQMPGLNPQALFTHFSCADSSNPEDVQFTINQQSKLVEFAGRYNLKYHSQNSAGVVNHGEFGGAMVRAGLALYGYFPGFRQVMSLKSAVAQIRQVQGGVPVSYSRTYVTKSPCTLAVIPTGYADGYSRLHSNRGRVMINGKAAEVRGRVCMDYIIVDVTGIDDVRVGSEVEIYGDIEQIAKSIGTIPYEVTCAVSQRVARIAVDN
jgi:alanine racemase